MTTSEMEALFEIKTDVALIKERLGIGDKKFEKLPCDAHAAQIARLRTQFEVMNERFSPVRLLVFGGAGMVLASVAGAVVALVMKAA